eukprot:3513333-Pyramimonas_sp.AAC.1
MPDLSPGSHFAFSRKRGSKKRLGGADQRAEGDISMHSPSSDRTPEVGAGLPGGAQGIRDTVFFIA